MEHTPGSFTVVNCFAASMRDHALHKSCSRDTFVCTCLSSPNLRSDGERFPNQTTKHQRKRNTTLTCRLPVPACTSPTGAVRMRLRTLRFSLFVLGRNESWSPTNVKGQCCFTLPQTCWPRSTVQPPPVGWQAPRKARRCPRLFDAVAEMTPCYYMIFSASLQPSARDDAA